MDVFDFIRDVIKNILLEILKLPILLFTRVPIYCIHIRRISLLSNIKGACNIVKNLHFSTSPIPGSPGRPTASGSLATSVTSATVDEERRLCTTECIIANLKIPFSRRYRGVK